MRKDVRLGLAVGSVLLFAVLVYVLFFTGPGTTKRTESSNTGGTGGPSVATNNNGPHITPPVTGGTTNNNIGSGSPLVRVPEPVVPLPATRPADPPGGPVIGLTPPNPAPNLTPLAHGETFDWGSALHRGLTGGGAATPGANANGNANVPAGAGARKYVVKPNDTFWTIARAEYGSGSYVNHIMRANPGVDAQRLRAGMTIILPEKPEVVPDTGPAHLAVAGPTTRPVDPATQYRVQQGDSLFTISKKLYGTINRAGKIYEANKDLIGPNANALKLNMVLRLPEPPTATVTPAAPAGSTPAVSDLR